VLAHNHNTEVCVAAGKEIASRATAFQLGAMLGVGRSGDREDELDLADIGGETGMATYRASIAGPGRRPKRIGRILSASRQARDRARLGTRSPGTKRSIAARLAASSAGRAH
jgi:hypothetical protein